MTKSAAWELFPIVLVRRAGLPVSALEPCRHGEALALHRRAKELRRDILATGSGIAVALHAVVPQLIDPARRRAALALRRELFRGGDVGAVASRLCTEAWTELAPRLAAYQALWRECHSVSAARDATFDRLAETKSAAILDAVRGDGLRLGLTMANPDLVVQLARLDPADIGGKKGRRALVSGYRYLVRAALKPIPHGRLSTTALLDLRGHRPDPAWSVIRLDRESLDDIEARVRRWPSLQDGLSVGVEPTLHRQGDACWILRDERYVPVSLGIAAFERLERWPGSVGVAAAAAALDISQEALLRLIDDHVLVAGLLPDTTDADELDVLARVLWQGVARDLSCLTVLAELEQLGAAVRDCGSTDPTARLAAMRRLEAIRSPGAGRSEKPIVHEDAFDEAGPHLFPDCQAFLAEIAHYGAPTRSRSLPGQMLAAVYDALLGDRPRIGLLAFHRQFLSFCERHGASPDPHESAGSILELLGRPEPDPVASVEADLRTALRQGGDDYRLACDVDDHDPSDQTQSRMTLRFRNTVSGSSRFQLLFWGADQMSLIPRYAARSSLRDRFADWMSRWPEVADIHAAGGRSVDVRPRTTARLIEAPNALSRPGSISLRDLSVVRTHAGLSLLDKHGAEVRPIVFGVSSWSRLPGLVRFMTALPTRCTSPLEAAVAGWGRFIARLLTEPRPVPVVVPATLVGEHMMLSPRALVFDPAHLPATPGRVSRPQFFAMHDWLHDHGLAPVLEVQTLTRSLVADLHHPLGVESFIRFLRDEPAALVHSYDARADRASEYYVEIARRSI